MGFQKAVNGMIGTLGKLWLAAALLFVGAPPGLAAQDAPVRVTFLDVGQGDAVLIQSPEGRTALIDAGPGVDVPSRLRGLGIDTLDLVIASHPHADHIGGMRQVLRAFPVRFYMDNGRPHTTATYSSVMRELRDRPEVVYLQATPRTIDLGSTRLHVLPLPPGPSSNLNDSSVGIVLEHGDFLGFFSGDSEQPQLAHFLQQDAVPDVTLLKAPHHGSDDAVSELFMQAARPEVVVIPVGWANRYGHPRPAALHTYRAHADHLLRTDVHGRVTVLGYRDGRYQIELGGSVEVGGSAEAGATAEVGDLERPGGCPNALSHAGADRRHPCPPATRPTHVR